MASNTHAQTSFGAKPSSTRPAPSANAPTKVAKPRRDLLNAPAIAVPKRNPPPRVESIIPNALDPPENLLLASDASPTVIGPAKENSITAMIIIKHRIAGSCKVKRSPSRIEDSSLPPLGDPVDA